MESGGSCLTLDETITTLSEKLGNEIMQQAILEIPPNVLPPGDYIFGLEVFNEKSKSAINSTVKIVTGDVPIVEVLAADTEVFPHQTFVAIGNWQSVSQMLQMSQKTHWAHNLISFKQVKTF